MEYHTTHPIVMAHQCEEAQASAHIPNLQKNKNVMMKVSLVKTYHIYVNTPHTKI